MKHFKLLILIVAFLSCRSENNEIQIGVITPLTGNDNRYGNAIKEGVELAMKDLENTANQRFKAVYIDDKSDTKLAIAGFQKLVKIDKVPAIIGPSLSSIASAVSTFCNDNEVVCLSTVATKDELKDAGDFFFRNISPNHKQFDIMLDFFRTKAVKKLGVLYENNGFGINMAALAKTKFNNTDEKVVFSFSYEENQNNFLNVITKLRNISTDYLFIAGTTNEMALIIKQLREQGINTPVITGDGGVGDEISEIAGNAANGLLCTIMGIKDTLNNNFIEFQKKYESTFQKKYDIYSAYTYDAVMIFANSFQKMEPPYTGKKLKEMLYNNEFEGVTGKYKFDKDGEVDKPFILVQYQNGSYIPFEY